MTDGRPAERVARSALPFATLLVLLTIAFAALGLWQVQRLHWKHDLIARVGARVHAPPADAPARARWAAVDAASSEYRHVRLAGSYLPEHTALVQAATALGSGWWVMTPLRTAEGIVFVNRGFVTPEAGAAMRRERYAMSCARQPEPGCDGRPLVVTGLLRLNEPGGGFLRENVPSADRWHSRDVVAIGAARGLHDVAPWFVDADALPSPPPGAPVGGLTVVSFHDNHLVYALTWFGLALMSAGACAWIVLRGARATGPAARADRVA